MLKIDPTEINTAIDSNPGSAFDLVRIAEDIDPDTARLIQESSDALPGVDVVVEARRQYTDGPLLSQIIGYTGPGLGVRSSPRSRNAAICPTTSSARPASKSSYETELRGVYGTETVERNARGQKTQVLADRHPGPAGRFADADDRHQGAAGGPEGAQVGDEGDRPQARGRDRDEPADRRGPRDGQPARRTTTTCSPAGSAPRPSRRSPRTRTCRCSTTRSMAHYPPGSTYKLVTGTGALADGKIKATTLVPTKGLPDPRGDEVLRLEPPRLRPVRHLLRLRPLERHVLLPAGRQARDRPARLLGEGLRLRGRRPASTSRARSPASCRRTPGSRPRSARRCSPARPTRPGSARATTSSPRSS